MVKIRFCPQYNYDEMASIPFRIPYRRAIVSRIVQFCKGKPCYGNVEGFYRLGLAVEVECDSFNAERDLKQFIGSFKSVNTVSVNEVR